jgi:hypothetical protein
MSTLQLPDFFDVALSDTQRAPSGNYQLNKGHSLAPDAQCVIPAVGLYDLASNEFADVLTTTKHIKVGQSRGVCFERTDRFTNSNYISYASAPRLFTSSGCTLHFRYYKSQDQSFAHDRLSSSSVGGYVAAQDAGGTSVQIRHRNGFTVTFAANTTPDASEWHDYTIVADGSDRHLYIDGEFIETKTTSGSDFEMDRLMAMAKGYLNHFYSYNRALTESEIKSLVREPYQILSPVIPASYFVPDAAGGQAVPIGISAETDTALPVTHSRVLEVGIASETDTAISLVISSSVEIGIASETDSALALNHSKSLTLGQPFETDNALSLSSSKLRPIGISPETDSALPLSISKLRSVGIATETDSALTITAIKADFKVIGIASETDTALSMRARKPVPISPVADITSSITFGLTDLHYEVAIEQSIPADINVVANIEINDINFVVKL